MTLSNFERMIRMAEEVFDAHHDLQQLQVDADVISRLVNLHQSSVTELDEGNGPLVWILLIPTTYVFMQDFLAEKISEQDLLDLTKPGTVFDAIYLCSAMVLPECRNKGIAKQLTIQAIADIRGTHPIEALFVWPFSLAGEKLAESIARETGLPVFKRKK
jgi:ribosomal protein S18 acetylase RimI-like enzyme